MYFTRVIKEKKNVDCQSIRSWHGICHILQRFTISAQKKRSTTGRSQHGKAKKICNATMVPSQICDSAVAKLQIQKLLFYSPLSHLHDLQQYCSSIVVLKHFCMISYESSNLNFIPKSQNCREKYVFYQSNKRKEKCRLQEHSQLAWYMPYLTKIYHFGTKKKVNNQSQLAW